MMFYNLDTYLEKLFSSKNMKLANEANEWGLCEIRLFVINLRHCGVVLAISPSSNRAFKSTFAHFDSRINYFLGRYTVASIF